MEAKDTVMNHNKKKRLIVERSHQQTVGETQEDMLLNAQAEISFKAGQETGRREVMDSLPKGLFIGDLPPEGGKSYSYLGCYILRWGKDNEPSIGLNRISDDEEWQAKLKEWGIK